MDQYPAIDKIQTRTTIGAVYFFTDAVSILGNWSAHAVDILEKRFPSVEHAYHYQKFNERYPEVAAMIHTARSPYEAMMIAKAHKTMRRADWESVKVQIMTDIVRAKVLQNQDVREVLLATGERTLIENSPWDMFWGCGDNGTGKNVAGKILMQIRSELRASTRRDNLLE